MANMFDLFLFRSDICYNILPLSLSTLDQLSGVSIVNPILYHFLTSSLVSHYTPLDSFPSAFVAALSQILFIKY